MLTFFGKTFQQLIRLLPAAVARTLLLLAIIGALALHVTATQRIRMLEDADSALRQSDALLTVHNAHVLNVLTELTAEVRGYRDDIREENKALKARLRQRQQD